MYFVELSWSSAYFSSTGGPFLYHLSVERWQRFCRGHNVLAMKSEMHRRLDYLDVDIAVMALAEAEKHAPKLLNMINAEPTKLLQTRYSSLASDYESIAWFSYAIGFPIEKVSEAFAKAAHAHLKVFELRGAESAFPAYIFKYDASHSPGTPESTVEFKRLHEDQDVDYSLTYSQKGYVAVCEALVSGNDTVADNISALIWDPPDASYIGPKSFCTSNDQHLAYALRQLIHGTAASVELELDQMKASKADVHIGHQAMMVRALAMNDPGGFLDGLSAFLNWHEGEASSRKNRRNPEFFICTVGAGLCRLAFKRQVCEFADFPQDNIFLPLGLISPA